MNPAIAFAVAVACPLTIPFSADKTFAVCFKNLWLYPLFPFIGTGLAIVFYEFIYKKAEKEISEEEIPNSETSSDSEPEKI